MINARRYDAVLYDVDLATEPREMSKAEALDWLETLIDALECRCEALKEEMSED